MPMHIFLKCVLLLCGILVFCCIFTFHRALNRRTFTEFKKLNRFQIVKNEHITDSLANKLHCIEFSLETKLIQHGSYWVAQNLVIGNISRNIGCADSITYATHGDYTFFWALPEVVKRWKAPISLAVYAPGKDIFGTMESIQYVRNCLAESDLIHRFVTFHIYFPEKYTPPYLPMNEHELLQWPYDCKNSPYVKKSVEDLHRNKLNLTYPINVGRNIARIAANTHFILSSDIELYPSPGIVDKFLQLITRNVRLAIGHNYKRWKPRVFVLRLYEVDENTAVPNSKLELKELLDLNLAVPFHRNVCDNCHRTPYEEEWLNLTIVKKMAVLGIAKREHTLKYWEPIYISDNNVPMYDERIFLEGRSTKRIQGFAMCLLDFEFFILNDGFLVHSPGIKKIDRSSRNSTYVLKINNLIRNVIRKEYYKLYGYNSKCRV